jgi:DNA helicase IV
VALIDEASHLLGPATAGRARRVPPALTESAQFDIDQVLAEMPGLSPVIRDDIVNRLTAQAIAARVEPEEQVADRDRWRTYGHVLVDEAQDLSAMQWRMIARRSATGSFTVVGDLAQGTSPWSPTAWAAVAEQLGAEPKTVELSVGYRTPAEVMTLAASLLAASRPALSPPRPVRRSGHPPERVFVDKDSIIARSLDAAARHQHTTGGTVAVIAPASLLALLDRGVVDEAISVLDPIGAKGLEFDAVVLTEPVRIAAEHGGLAALYIAVTRTTDRLTIVHSQPLPAPLGTGTEYRVGGGRSVG